MISEPDKHKSVNPLNSLFLVTFQSNDTDSSSCYTRSSTDQQKMGSTRLAIKEDRSGDHHNYHQSAEPYK